MTQIIVKNNGWPRPVVASLTAVWDAVDAAGAELRNAVREEIPGARDLQRPVRSLAVLSDAVDAAEVALRKAVWEKIPCAQDVKRLQKESHDTSYDLLGFLLDTLAPEPVDDDQGTAEEETARVTAPAT
jgi:hypothetical protein